MSGPAPGGVGPAAGLAAPRPAAASSGAPVREFHYRVARPAAGHFPGHHRSSRGDSGLEFRGHASLLDAPDARRLDLHASLRDPFGNWLVRVHSQRKSIPVTLVADLSASMGFEGARRRLDVVADFAESLAQSAWRTGDSFGFLGCDEAVREDVRLAQTRAGGAGAPLARALRALQPAGRSARGLLDAPRHLGRQRALVFLLSDFHLGLPEVAALAAGFGGHDLVPVVVWDRLEFAPAGGSGLADLVDPESGARRLLWWRPALRERWALQRGARRAALLDVFRAQRVEPLWMDDGFDADAVTRHFFA